MIPIIHSVVINRPIEEVFTFVSDFCNDVLWWKSAIRTDKVTQEEIGVGTLFINYTKVLFITTKNQLKVTKWEPYHLAQYRNENPLLAYNLFYRFESVDGGTRFTLEAHLEMGGVFNLLKPLIIRVLQGQLASNFLRLKNVLETGQASPTPN